jgi:hypothetical protein
MCAFQANRLERIYFCASNNIAHLTGFGLSSILCNIHPFARLLGVDTH